MNKPTNTNGSGNPIHGRSIRDELEQMAGIQNPRLASRLKKRLQGQQRHFNGGDEGGRRIMRWQQRILLILGAVLLALFVIRTETARADEWEWGLQLNSDLGTYTELAINTGIEVAITGLVARVVITQQFTNRSTYWAEGNYRFPLPDGAAVDRMLVRVGERILEGEIQEKATARQTYQEARDAGQTATIVEQQRQNQFETRLANIGPGERIEITIAFLQNVSYADFSYHLRLPMTFTPRWLPGQSTSGELSATRDPQPHLESPTTTASHGLKLVATLVSSLELAAIESRYHDVDIRPVDDGYRIELLNPDELTGRDFELSWTPVLQSLPGVSLTTFNDGESVYAQLMLAPPLADSIKPQPREVILIIDTSGSMEGSSLLQAKAALSHALNSLGPHDSFNLLQFNSVTEALFEQSVPFTPPSRYAAQNFINTLQANGGTDMEPALRTALTMAEDPRLMRQVVFITDGAVGNEAGLLQMVAQNLGSNRMFTVAIGHAPNSWFMRKVAEIGRGSYIHIGKPEEVEEQMSALWSRIQLPALTDICVDWGDSAEYYPEVIPDLYAGEPLWLIVRLPNQPAMVDLCGIIGARDWNLSINGWDAAYGGFGGDNLAKLWAAKKIESLEDSLMFGSDPELIQLEVTGLALDYGLLTRYTSLVAVDKTPRRESWEPLTQSDIPGLLPGAGTTRLAGYPATASGWVSKLLLSLFVLLLASAMLLLTPVSLRSDSTTTRFPMVRFFVKT